MITLKRLYELIEKYLKINYTQYNVKYYNPIEKSFRLNGNGFSIGFSTKWVNEFRITQTPFKNLYYGKDYRLRDLEEDTIISVLKDVRLYLDNFKTFIELKLKDLG